MKKSCKGANSWWNKIKTLPSLGRPGNCQDSSWASQSPSLGPSLSFPGPSLGPPWASQGRYSRWQLCPEDTANRSYNTWSRFTAAAATWSCGQAGKYMWSARAKRRARLHCLSRPGWDSTSAFVTEPVSLSPFAAILAIHLQCPENRVTTPDHPRLLCFGRIAKGGQAWRIKLLSPRASACWKLRQVMISIHW